MRVCGSSAGVRVLMGVMLLAALCVRPGMGTRAGSRQEARAEQAAGFALRFEDGRVTCHPATADEAAAMARREERVEMQPLARTAPEAAQQSTGLKITLRSTAQLDANPAAKSAFVKAAQKWESLIRTPITVVVDVDFGTTAFGTAYTAGTLGTTTTQLVSAPSIYPTIRTALLARANGTQETNLYNALPANAIPTDIGTSTAVLGPTPVFRALGLLPPVADPTAEQAQLGQTPAIGFNSAYKFDFDPSDGLQPDAVDFDSVAFHEMGHVLGFFSNVGSKELFPTSDVTPALLDLFRFRPGTTLATFPTALRILASGGDQNFFDGGQEVPFSTARPDNTGGDGNQASHWKDDLIFGGYFGTMDPTIGYGLRNLVTLNDLRAMDVIGYQLRTAATAGTTELKIDDNSVEGGIRNDGMIVVNRLTPASYPATLQSIRIQFRSFSGQPDPTGKPISLVYFTDPNGAGTPPNGVTLTRVSTTVPGTSATTFFDFPIQNGPTITSGDFYVGFAAPTPNQGVGFPLDTNSSPQNRSFLSITDGSSFQAISAPPGTASANAMIRANISSAGSAPAFETTTTSLAFGNVAAGATLDKLITIRNSGTAILNLNGMASDNIRFGIVALTNSFIIAPGGQETFGVRFSPIAQGGQTATLSIPTNDPAKPTVNIPLSGNGVAPQINRILRAVASNGTAGSSVTVPIELDSQGDENGLGFSIAYDPAVLTNPQATLGPDAPGASFNVNTNLVAQGRLGLGLVLPTGQKFATGTRRIVSVAFTIAANTTASTTNVTFGDQPIAREVVDATATPLQATYSGAAVTIAQGLEADVSPRPTGNGSVSVADWVQIGRFIAGLDAVTTGAEFQRADCAPKDTRGNGALTVADWVQAGRYAAGLDPTVAAGGPTGPTAAALFGEPFALSPLVRGFVEARANVAVTMRLDRTDQGHATTVTLLLDGQGDETAAGFSVRFDPRALRFASAALDVDAADATLLVNDTGAAQGRVGLALALPNQRSFGAGTRRLVTLRFTRAPRANGDIRFDDAPVLREVVNSQARSLPLAFAQTDSTVKVERR